jgi:glycosyltransferase involved in cell wall biosynthesis
VPEEDLPAFYEALDYVLIPATVEGGPMSLLEGLGMGKRVIAPAGVGMVPEFGETEFLRRYPPGDAEALVRLVTTCYEEKCRPRRLVEVRTWQRWAADHDTLFRRLLHDAHARPLR